MLLKTRGKFGNIHHSRRDFSMPAVALPVKPPLSKQVQNVKRSVKKINNKIELIHKDTQVSVMPQTTGAFTLLNEMATGDTPITRSGNDITGTSIQWRIRHVADPLLILNGYMWRHIIFYDRQTNGTTPLLQELLDISIITQAINAPYNRDNQKRFKIIHDKTGVMNPNHNQLGSTTQNLSLRGFEKGKRRLSAITKYDGSTAAIGDIVSNALWSVYIGDQNTLTPTMQVGYRFFAKDA